MEEHDTEGNLVGMVTKKLTNFKDGCVWAQGDVDFDVHWFIVIN